MPTGEHPSLKFALLRGFLGRCPHCGSGQLFRRFLKVTDHCSACGEAYFHHRADDFPPYLVMVVVGHVVGALILYVAATQSLSLWSQVAVFIPLALALSLGLLQPAKGAVVALQWHLGMHGFAESRKLHQEGA